MRYLDFALTVAITIALATAIYIVHGDWRPRPAKPQGFHAPKTPHPAAAHSLAGTLSQIGGPAGEIVRPTEEEVWIEIADSGTAQGSAAAFDVAGHETPGNGSGCPYHYVIGNGSGAPDGAVEPTERGSAGKLGPGAPRLRICVVGRFDISEPTAAQKSSLVELCARLSSDCDIPPERVVGAEKREGLSIAWLRDRLRK